MKRSKSYYLITFIMDFKKIENVLKFLDHNDWNSGYEHDDALGVALTPESIDDIFKLITKNTDSPLIYESGCSAGHTTIQICKYLSEKGVENYKLVAHDVREDLVTHARQRFSGNKNIRVELRSGCDYSDISDESIDGIFALNSMIPFLHICYAKEGNYYPYKDYLEETSRVLKEGKPLVLTYLYVPLVLIKDSKIGKAIPFQVRLYKDHQYIEPFLKVLEYIKPVK